MSILEHGHPPLAGARVIDLFAGTGAVGLECLSRGATALLLIESDRTALTAIRRNVELLGEGARTDVRPRDATQLGAAPQRFDIAFLDPPYGQDLVRASCAGLVGGGWLASGARVVIQTAAAEALAPLPGLEPETARRYGRTCLHFLRAAG